MDDKRLLERVRNTDHDAFRLLFEQYQPILFRIVLQSVQDVEKAHDIVQETFVRMWNHRRSLRPHLPLLGYLLQIGRNLIRDAAKHSAVLQKHEGAVRTLMSAAPETPDEILQETFLREQLSGAVRNALPPKCREIFLLSRMEEMSNAEISAHLGISIKTVENQIGRALKILRQELRMYLDPGRG